MINNYEIEFTSKEIKEIMEAYFKQKYKEEIIFEIKTTREYTGFHEQEVAVTKYYGIKNIEIVGLNKTAKFELTESDIKSILQEIFKKYDLVNITFQNKLEVLDYTVPNKAVFKGIKIKLKLKEQEHIKEYNEIIDVSEPSTQQEQSMYDPSNKGGYYEDWSLRR